MHELGREVTRKLIASADVVIANLPPATLRGMGLDYETLRAIRPEIILADISAFGNVGPLRDSVGFDSIGQVMCGTAFTSGDPSMPRRSLATWVDFATALHAAFAVAAALLGRRNGKGGQHIQCNLLATALAINGPALVEEAMRGTGRPPTGNRSPYYAPSDIFATRDGHIMCSVLGQPLFRRWVRLVAAEQWLHDPRFADDPSRAVHGDILSARMTQWCAARTTEQALAELHEARLPAGPVLKPSEALRHEQVVALGLFHDVELPGNAEPASIPTTPIFWKGTPSPTRCPPPTLGQHTDQILAGVGYTPGEIAALRRAGAV
jgi:crotonobetainyl-CoA:carnitine CoA-transferase CaiB-like acyl-CoA transferase